MAILHKATLSPSKPELLTAHLAAQQWFTAMPRPPISLLGAYRFDDPAGQVGVETHLVTTGSGPVIHVPLTYRAAPLLGAEEWFIATMDHSFLGKRWVYNACGDPVYVTELCRAILTGGSHVEQFVQTDEGMVVREPTAMVFGSGTSNTPVPTIDSVQSRLEADVTVIHAGGLELHVRHILADVPTAAGPTLSGTWAGTDAATVLAVINQN